jgi:citrate synthase
MREMRPLPKHVLAIMHVFPGEAEPMDVLRTVVSALAMYKDVDLQEEDSLFLHYAQSLTARMPSIVAGLDRLRHDSPVISPRADLGRGANFLYMLTGREPDPLDAQDLETYMVMMADHGMNPSTFSARVTASTLSSNIASITTALGSLMGPLHGGAVSAGMRQLLEIGRPENVEDWVEERLTKQERIAGFGHRVYKVEDPRAAHLRQMTAEITQRKGDDRWFQVALGLEKQVLQHPYFRHRSLYTNVDYYAGLLLYTLGIPMDLCTPVFSCARIAGMLAHVREQRANNRLIRPRSRYVGPGRQKWVPLEQRGSAD